MGIDTSSPRRTRGVNFSRPVLVVGMIVFDCKVKIKNREKIETTKPPTEGFWFAIPVVNVLLALRELLLNRIVLSHIAIWIVSSTLYPFGAAYYAARQFKREDIVTSLS